MKSTEQVTKRVATVLRQAGLTFERKPSIGGLRPDFLVRGPNGEVLIVEGKAWPSDGGHTARAQAQADFYRDATGVDHAILVLPELKRNYANVVNVEGLAPALQKYLATSGARKRAGRASKPGPTRIVFAAMPFAREYDDTFFVAMTYAARAAQAVCQRVDRTEFAGDIVTETRQLIRQSAAVVVDLSESKPNVLYEAGFAHALGKPTVHICSTPMDRLPFDVRNWNTIPYRRGQTTRLRTALAKRLKAVLR